MSPEQAAGDTAILDHRTDIYSLGTTLYELVCLRPAFDGKNRQQILQRVLKQPPPLPRRLDPSIPRDLETIILKAMAKDSTCRYRDANEFADDLRRFVDREPIRARRTSRAEHVKSWARRNPLIATLITVVFVLLSVLAAGTTWNSLNIHQKNDEIAQRLYAADMHGAQLALEQGDLVAPTSATRSPRTV